MNIVRVTLARRSAAPALADGELYTLRVSVQEGRHEFEGRFAIPSVEGINRSVRRNMESWLQGPQSLLLYGNRQLDEIWGIVNMCADAMRRHPEHAEWTLNWSRVASEHEQQREARHVESAHIPVSLDRGHGRRLAERDMQYLNDRGHSLPPPTTYVATWEQPSGVRVALDPSSMVHHISDHQADSAQHLSASVRSRRETPAPIIRVDDGDRRKHLGGFADWAKATKATEATKAVAPVPDPSVDYSFDPTNMLTGLRGRRITTAIADEAPCTVGSDWYTRLPLGWDFDIARSPASGRYG